MNATQEGEIVTATENYGGLLGGEPVEAAEPGALDIPAQEAAANEALYNPVMPATGEAGVPWNPTAETADEIDVAKKLRKQTAAVRLQTAKFGIRKTLSAGQRQQAAMPFAADPEALSARKRLINTRDAAYRDVTGCLSQAIGLWRAFTIPYPEKGIRLIRRDRIAEFKTRMDEIVVKLEQGVEALAAVYPELREAARTTLGSLYDENDYPASLAGKFSIDYDFPNVDPPEYLRQINPALYEEQVQRMQARFSEAVRLTEQAFIAELQELVTHLCERLQPDADGKQKTFKDATVENLNAFFKKFAELDLGGADALKGLVHQAEAVLANQNADVLRKDVTARQALAEAMAGVKAQIDAVAIAKPGRAFEFEDDAASDAAGEPEESAA